MWINGSDKWVELLRGKEKKGSFLRVERDEEEDKVGELRMAMARKGEDWQHCAKCQRASNSTERERERGVVYYISRGHVLDHL